MSMLCVDGYVIRAAEGLLTHPDKLVSTAGPPGFDAQRISTNTL